MQGRLPHPRLPPSSATGSDADHRYHGETGAVVVVTGDDLGELFDDPRLNHLVTVEFDDERLGRMTFRFHDLQRARAGLDSR